MGKVVFRVDAVSNENVKSRVWFSAGLALRAFTNGRLMSTAMASGASRPLSVAVPLLAEFHLVSASLSVNDDLLSIPFLVEIILHYRLLNIIRNLAPTILVHVEVDVVACAYVYSVSRSYIKCLQPFLMLPLSKEYRRCFMFSHILTVPPYHESFISFPLWRETTSFTFFFISFCSSRPSVFVRSRNDL